MPYRRQKNAATPERAEAGFSLIELMVAVLIIAVLIAIAIPTFSGIRAQSQNTGTQAELRQALPGLKAYLQDGGDPTTADVGVKAYSPSVSVDTAGIAGIKFDASADGAVCMWRVSPTGNVYGIWEPPTNAGWATRYAELTALPATCPVESDTVAFGFTSSW